MTLKTLSNEIANEALLSPSCSPPKIVASVASCTCCEMSLVSQPKPHEGHWKLISDDSEPFGCYSK